MKIIRSTESLRERKKRRLEKGKVKNTRKTEALAGIFLPFRSREARTKQKIVHFLTN